MPKINQLDKSVYELIAAGEVIERPSSVIKELCENAIDAGARTISVEIKHGGISYMRVTDDGCGISYEDMPLAFMRHATSKVLTAQDLENINTLGFRGEALASVCAVSRVEAVSRRAVDKLGVSYKLEGTEPTEYDKIGCAEGTTIIIRDLFYNTPARLKFLKKDVTEGNYVANVVEKLALSHPDISFRFIREGKQTIFTSGDGSFYSAIHAVFGKQFAASVIPVENIYREIGVTGYVSSPLFSRSNRTMQNFFVNGRSVKSPLCCAAIEEAYKNSIMVGKFPACVLCINLDPALLDANISPAKTEVRFSNEKAVFDAIYFAVKNALTGYDESREIKLSNEKGMEDVVSTVHIPTERVSVGQEIYSVPKPKPSPESFYKKPFDEINAVQPTLSGNEIKSADKNEEPFLKPEPRIIHDVQPNLSGFSFLSEKSFEKREPKSESISDAAEGDQPETYEKKAENNADIRVIGELFKTYIVCESEETLILIDKHAAHERINFERFKRGTDIHGQLLIEPCAVFLSAEEFEAVKCFKQELENVGILVKLDEDGKAFVEGVPQSLEGCDPEDLLQSVAEILASGNGNAEGALFDDALHTMACKASIRANEIQSIAELTYLAKTVLRDSNIRYCPHGRPIITQISKRQIERYFGRII
ncbi:MAG: DNA mismatch repair endonuclease MutL [Oscillospiraceae bacterium]|nr:DNA mismatch repair endonuclease MutL [Oscillospiraceae bacterium]